MKYDGEGPFKDENATRFDDIMLALDAVDTLRHEAAVVDTELTSDERREAMIVRLREYYAGQGIEVSEEILDRAVADMDANRFVHRPLPPGLSRTLALAWVRRGRYLRRTAFVAALGMALAAVGDYAYDVGVVKPRERAAAELAADLETRIPQAIAEQHARALDAAGRYRDPSAAALADTRRAAALEHVAAGRAADARGEVDRIRALADDLEAKIVVSSLSELASELREAVMGRRTDAGAAAALTGGLERVEAAALAGDMHGFSQARGELEALIHLVDQELPITIVDREGVRSGVWRTNDGGRTRVYYVVVEALDPSGNPVAMDIRNFETGRTEKVTHWGVQVSEAAYRAVEADKVSDGVVDDRAAGRKPSGSLGFEWTIDARGGHMITRW